jgi:hypothetical protein
MMWQVSAAGVAAILIGIVSGPAHAFDVSVGDVGVSTDGGGVSVDTGGGGSSDGGTSAGASTGNGSSGGVSVGGDSIASVGGGTGGTSASGTITNNSGQLVDLSRSGTAANGTVNLGGVTGNLPDLTGLPGTIPLPDILGGTPDTPDQPPGQPPPGTAGGGVTVTPTQLALAYQTLSPSEQMALRTKCTAVLHRPAAYDIGLVTLCKVIGRMSR